MFQDNHRMISSACMHNRRLKENGINFGMLIDTSTNQNSKIFTHKCNTIAYSKPIIMEMSLFALIPRELLWSILQMVQVRDLFWNVPLVCRQVIQCLSFFLTRLYRDWKSIAFDQQFWINKIKQGGTLDADWTIKNLSWRKQCW